MPTQRLVRNIQLREERSFHFRLRPQEGVFVLLKAALLALAKFEGLDYLGHIFVLFWFQLGAMGAQSRKLLDFFKIFIVHIKLRMQPHFEFEVSCAQIAKLRQSFAEITTTSHVVNYATWKLILFLMDILYLFRFLVSVVPVHRTQLSWLHFWL